MRRDEKGEDNRFDRIEFVNRFYFFDLFKKKKKIATFTSNPDLDIEYFNLENSPLVPHRRSNNGFILTDTERVSREFITI